jgi:hypothetical protein
LDTHVYKDPLLLDILLAALEGRLDVFIPVMHYRERPIPPKIILVYRAGE